MHNLQGTTIFQSARTDNWLHLPVAAEHGSSIVQQRVSEVFFKCTANENARIDEIRLTDERQIVFRKTVNFVGEEVDELIRFTEVPFVGGLVLTLHVAFLDGTPEGRMEFRNGGAATRAVGVFPPVGSGT
jgi:hypothetical protein